MARSIYSGLWACCRNHFRKGKVRIATLLTIDRTRQRTQLALLGCAAVVALLSLIPVFYLTLRSGMFGPAEMPDTLWALSSARLIGRSLLLASSVAASSVVVALFLGWFTLAEDLPFRRILSVLVIVPLAVPCYVAATAWIASTSHGGSMRELFGWLHLGIPGRPEGFVWSWLVLTCFTYPYALLPIRASIRRLDACQYESARSSGAKRHAATLATLLPQLQPAVITGAVLVMLYTLAEFGAVTMFRYDTFTRVIYQQYQSSFDRTAAAFTSMLLVVVIVLVMVGSEWFSRRNKDSCCASGCEDSLDIRLGAGRWLASIGTILFVLMTSGYVVFELLRWALKSVPTQQLGSLGEALSTSVLLAAGGAVATVVASYPAAWIASRMKGVAASVLERITHFGFGLPGIVVALGLAATALQLSGFINIYQSWLLIVLAYVVLFVPQSSGAIRASLSGTPRVLEDAATSLGARNTTVFARVTFPMIRPGIFAGGTLVFLSAMKELPATLLLSPPGLHTFSTRVWGYMEESMYAQAALPALGLIAVSMIIVALVSIAEHERKSPVLAATTLDAICSCEKPDCAACGRRQTRQHPPVVSLTVSTPKNS